MEKESVKENFFWTQVYPSGNVIDLLDVDPKMIRLTDVAHHLSLINRYAGGTRLPVNVLTHTLNCWHIYALAGGSSHAAQLAILTHDVGEYVTGDIISPVKALIRSKTKILQRVEGSVRKAFMQKYFSASSKEYLALEYLGESGPFTTHEVVKMCDLEALRRERINFIGEETLDWQIPKIPAGIKDILVSKGARASDLTGYKNYTPEEARETWMLKIMHYIEHPELLS